MDSIGQKRHFSTQTFFSEVFFAQTSWVLVWKPETYWIWGRLNVPPECVLCYLCLAACLGWECVHGCLPFCILSVCLCVCVWLEILSMLYYTEAQKTQRLIRETYQTLALGGIDSLSVDPVDHSCPGWVPLPAMLNFTPAHQRAWPFCMTTSNHF